MGSPGKIHDRMPDCHGCMDNITKERSFSQATLVIDVFGLFINMLSMSVCTIRHRQMAGRLQRELNDCTVPKKVNSLSVNNDGEDAVHISF